MPIDPTVDDGQPVQALDYQLRQQRGDGYSTISGCAVSINTGDLGAGNNTLTVDAGRLLVGGSIVDVASQSVDIPTSDADPRKDLVVYDEAAAAIDVYSGTPEPSEPRDASGIDAIRPAPPDVAGGGATVLSEVWVAGGASSVGSGDLTDRRVFADGTLALLDVVDDLGIPIYASDADAPTETLFFHSGAGQLRYKDSTGTATADADTLDGLNSGQFARSDVNDTLGGVIGFEADDAVNGTLGNSNGEVWRAGGFESDFLLNHTGGHGRVVQTWNAWFDSANSTWASIVGGEPHAAIGFDASDPGLGTGIGNVTLAAAPSNTNAGDPITWTSLSWDENGDLTGQPNFSDGYAEAGRERIVDGTWSESGVAQASYTLTQNYDKVVLDIDSITGSSTSLEYLQMQLNGDTTANYDWITASGTRSTGNSQIRSGRFTPASQSGGGSPEIEGRWAGNVSVFGPLGVGSGNNDLVSAKNDALASPLNSIQLQFGTGNISIDATVYGVGL